MHGSVGDGPIVSATISVYDKNGNLIGTQVSDGSAAYELTVHARSRDYPLIIEASGGLDLVSGKIPDFTLKSIALNPGKRKRVNINPHSTLIVAAAQNMEAGASKPNIDTATQYVLDELNFGWDATWIGDPATGDINETNIAAVIKSSESLGEMIRRARDALVDASVNVNGDEIVAAIAADIVDGALDGLGSRGASAHIAAVVNIVSAQVLLEAMRNELRVNDVDASSLMDDALRVTYPTTTEDTSTDNVQITEQALQQARVTYNAACEVDVNLDCTDRFLDQLNANDSPQQAMSIVPAAAIDQVGSIVPMIAQGQADQWETVNQVVRNELIGATPTNNPPAIVGSPATSVLENNAYLFEPSASDSDGDSLTFIIVNRPSWASFNSNTGVLTGTPSSGDVGITEGISISVTDGIDTVSLPSFSITVARDPEPSGEFNFAATSYSIEEGNIVSLEITRSNSNGSATVYYSTFEISAVQSQDYQGVAPTAVTFVDGESSLVVNITTIDDTAVEDNETFEVTLSSPSTNYSLGSATSTVVTISDNDVAANNPPTIGGNPPTSLTANSSYTFTPTASDMDGDILSFGIANQPSWASFDATTGTLSGTPGDSDAGTYQNIVISVSDGINSVSLTAFSITVTSTIPSTGSATLSWNPPTQYVDGTALTDLAGYKIYYGTSPGVYGNIININNPGITTYVVENLSANTTFYFVITAVNVAGLESAYSNMASKTIQ
ncbi:putative Ig domain-containing protein [Kaarinaea lacus]